MSHKRKNKAPATQISVTYKIPLKLVSLTNQREHWAKKARRAKAERNAAIVVRPHPLPCRITLTRYGPRKMDGDNLLPAFKSLRDGIADRLGVDDGDERLQWEYQQFKSNDYSVKIEIESI